MICDPGQLLCFHAVAKTRHVTAAAQQLGVSQPAVSKQVKALERVVGAPLIERAGRGIRLTALGQALAEYAARLASLLDEADHAMAEMRGLRRGRLAVAASPTIATYLLPRLLVRYRLKYPEISLHVEVEQSAAMTPRLLDGKLDLALTEVAPTEDRLVSRIFMRDRLQAIVPRRHPLTRQKSITLQQFLGAGLIVRDSTQSDGSFVEQELRRRLGAPINPLLRVSSTEALKEAVAAGLGVAIVPGLSLQNETPSKRVVPVRVRDFTLSRPLFCVRPTTGRPSKSATAFLCMLDHAARGTLPPLSQRITPATKSALATSRVRSQARQ